MNPHLSFNSLHKQYSSIYLDSAVLGIVKSLSPVTSLPITEDELLKDVLVSPNGCDPTVGGVVLYTVKSPSFEHVQNAWEPTEVRSLK